MISTVPRIGYEGIKKLESGTRLFSFDSGVSQPLLVESVEKYPCGPSEETLYDLILESDSLGHFQYIVGTEKSLFVVASEIPTLKKSTTAELLAALALLDITYAASQSSLTDSTRISSKVSEQLFCAKMDHIAHQLSRNLLLNASSLTYIQNLQNSFQEKLKCL